jgi:hypothetical protein
VKQHVRSILLKPTHFPSVTDPEQAPWMSSTDQLIRAQVIGFEQKRPPAVGSFEQDLPMNSSTAAVDVEQLPLG